MKISLSGSASQRDVLLWLARCSWVKLFLVVCGSRMVVLLAMFFFRAVIPKIIGTDLLFDNSILLYNDAKSPWRLLDFPRTWDGVHFFHIAKHGYSHENICAFFPLVPFIVRAVSWVNEQFLPLYLAVIPIPFQVALLNVLFGGCSAVILRRITALTLLGSATARSDAKVHGTWLDQLPPPLPSRSRHESSSQETGVKLTLWREVGAAMAMWILSPTSVFTVVLYTESIFSLLTFLGLYLLILSPQTDKRLGVAAEMGAVLCFFLAGCTRSNGTMYVMFLLYPIFMQFFFFGTFKRRYVQQYGTATTVSRWPSLTRVVIFLLEAAFIFAPYLMFNYFCFTRFTPLWDDASREAIGNRFWSFYGWMQKRYWNVGFLTFYQWKNIPNILICLPILFFTIRGVILFYLCPALRTSKAASLAPSNSISTSIRNQFGKHAPSRSYMLCNIVESLVQSSNVLQLLLLMIIGVSMVHLNVVNRLVMSSPALYWIWGRQLVWDPWGGCTVVMLRIFVVWNCIGAVFLPNGMPWT